MGCKFQCFFINVETNGLIDAEGWGEMNSGDKTTAVFNEYNVTSNGEAYASTGATNNTLEAVASYIDGVDAVLGSWVPVHAEVAEKPAAEKTTDGRTLNAGETIYVVQKDDCLWYIALQLLGDADKCNELFTRNNDIIANADLIYPGQELIVPAK